MCDNQSCPVPRYSWRLTASYQIALNAFLYGYRIFFSFDIATLAELKKANKSKEPSQHQLGKLPQAYVQLSPTTSEETVYLFPFSMTSGLRKIEITGHQKHFTYNVKAMKEGATDLVYKTVYNDIGGEVFEDSCLAAAFENVKTPLSSWLLGMEEKRIQRATGSNGNDDSDTQSCTGDGAMPHIPGVNLNVGEQQQGILDSIKRQREQYLAAQSGSVLLCSLVLTGLRAVRYAHGFRRIVKCPYLQLAWDVQNHGVLELEQEHVIEVGSLCWC